jgi:hypothetical protein
MLEPPLLQETLKYEQVVHQYRQGGREIQTACPLHACSAAVDSFITPVAEVNSPDGSSAAKT